MQLPTGLPDRGVSSTRTDDGVAMSIIFDNFKVQSNPTDQTQSAESAVLNFEVPLAADSTGMVRVEARGFMATSGAHSWVHAVTWINGQRMEPISNSGESNENFYAALCVDATGQTQLRVSVTLLAQRDLALLGSESQVMLDTLDFTALSSPQAR